MKRQFNQAEKLTEFAHKEEEGTDYLEIPIGADSDRAKSITVSEEMYRRIFEDSIDGILLWDNHYHVVDINRVAEQMFERSKEKVIGRSVFELFPRNKRREIAEHIKMVFQQGECSSVIIYDINAEQKRYFEYSTKREIMEGLNYTVFQDITEKVEIEEQLRKSETLNVIGELAAGIAHEIRNPMTALKGFIQLLEGSIREEHSMYYQVITSELERIETIINEFLLLAKPQAIRFQEKDINQIMKETIDLLNAQAVLHNVQFETFYNFHLPQIFCEPNQLKKVFVNLIKNAIEVMPNGGTITVRIGGCEKGQIHITIQDEGLGISKEKLKRLGEPFYTTKERGTGLGLMVSYRIIEEHQGQIRIESEEGKGTIFHIYLPIENQNNNKKSLS